MSIEERAQAAITAITSLVEEMELPLEERNSFMVSVAVRVGQNEEFDEFLGWFQE